MQSLSSGAKHQLKSGESLCIQVYEPGVGEPPAPLEAIRDLIVWPREPWFGPTGREEVERGLWGKLTATRRDFFVLGLLDGEPVGGLWYQVSRRSPEVGAFGYVFTHPQQRGKGISTLLCRAAVAHFASLGGLCLYLGTGTADAHHVYEKAGFRDYNGIVMRYVVPPHDPAGLDTLLFAHDGPATVRPVEWGDGGMVDALFSAPYPWLVRSYRLHSFSHPAVQQRRCHIFPDVILPAERGSGACMVLENALQRLVGIALLSWGDAQVEPHVATLDFIVQPSYSAQTGDLLAAAREAAVAGGRRLVQTYQSAGDREKREALRQAGFALEAVLPGRLRAGAETFDLEIWKCELQ